jgi:hypothetical protein
MRPDRQPVATESNGFGLLKPFSEHLHFHPLPLVAPALLHESSMRGAAIPWANV